MINRKTIAVACALLSINAPTVSASEQSESKGFVEDSKLKLLLRNAYFNRDYKNRANDAKVWGQGFISTFQSGFTPSNSELLKIWTAFGPVKPGLRQKWSCQDFLMWKWTAADAGKA